MTDLSPSARSAPFIEEDSALAPKEQNDLLSAQDADNDSEQSISERLSELRRLMEDKLGRRITDEELASRFRVSKSSIGNWKRDMVKTLLPETERRFQELYDEAMGKPATSSAPSIAPVNGGGQDVDQVLLEGTVSIVNTYLQRCSQQLSAEQLRHLIGEVKRGLAS